MPERAEGAADALIGVDRNARIEEIDERVDDHQAGAGSSQLGLEPFELRRNAEWLAGVFGRFPAEDAVLVAAQGEEARQGSPGVTVFTLQDDRAERTGAGRPVGHGPAGAETRAEIERDQRLPFAGVAFENGEGREGKGVEPEPIERLGLHVAQGLNVMVL